MVTAKITASAKERKYTGFMMFFDVNMVLNVANIFVRTVIRNNPTIANITCCVITTPPFCLLNLYWLFKFSHKKAPT